MNIPIYSPIKSRDGTLSRDSYMRNAFVEKNKEGYRCCRRPGLLEYSTSTPAIGQGITGYVNSTGEEFLFQALGGALYYAGVAVPPSSFDPISSTDAFVLSTRELCSATLLEYSGTFYLIGFNDSNGASQRIATFTSTDNGVTWTKILDTALGSAGVPDAGFQYAAGCVQTDGTLTIVGVQLGTGNAHQCLTSIDGITWTLVNSDIRSADTSPYLCRRVVQHSDGAMYAFFQSGSGTATSNTIYTSTDAGVTWTSTGASQAFDSGTGRQNAAIFSYKGYLWVVGGSLTSSGKKVWKSTDGTSFSEVGSSVFLANDTDGNINIGWVDTGAMYVLICSGINKNKIYRSINGTTWALANTVVSSDDTDPLIDGALGGSAVNFGTSFNSGFGSWDGYTYLWASPASGDSTVRMFRGINSSSAISVGLIGNGLIDFTQNYARTRLIIKSSSVMYVLDTDANTLALVSDSDYPDATARGVVYLDGFFFVMDTDGNIFNSAEEDATSWEATDFLAAQFEPDGGVALAKYNLYIVAFGEYTTEFFWNAGNATGSPLLPVQQGVMNVGCADGDTVGTIDSQVIWVAQSKSQGQSIAAGRFVAQLQGNSYLKLSTPDIDRLLDADDFNDVDSTTFKVGGHSYYHLRLGSSSMSLVFDLSEQQWYVWTRRRDSFTTSISSVVIASGTATATMTSSWADGDVGVVTGFTGTYTALNGTHNFEVSGNVHKFPVTFSGTGTSTGTGTATGWTEDDFGVICAAGYQGRQILQDKSNGDLYELDITTYRDDSIYMDWSSRLMIVDKDSSSNKFAAWADLVSDRNSGNVLLRYSDDDCQNFTRYRKRSLAGDRTRWHRQGSYVRRSYEVRVTDNIPVRAEHLEIDQ